MAFVNQPRPDVETNPPEIAGLMIRAYEPLVSLNRWFPLMRPASKPLFLGGYVWGGAVDQPYPIIHSEIPTLLEDSIIFDSSIKIPELPITKHVFEIGSRSF